MFKGNSEEKSDSFFVSSILSEGSSVLLFRFHGDSIFQINKDSQICEGQIYGIKLVDPNRTLTYEP